MGSNDIGIGGPISWEFKEQALKSVVFNRPDMTRTQMMLKIAELDRSSDIFGGLYSAAGHWKEVFPTSQYEWWWRKVLIALKVDKSVDVDKILRATPELFCELVHTDFRTAAEECLRQYYEQLETKNKSALSLGLPAKKPPYSIGGVPAFFQSDIPQIIQSEVADKKALDQRSFYLRTQSPNDWADFTGDMSYEVYSKCEASLSVLCRSKKFNKAFDDAIINRVVMLGGAGCSSKDVKLLSALAKQERFGPNNPLTYLLFDISQWMLLPSLAEISRRIKSARKGNWADNVVLKAGVGDFMKLSRLKKHFREDDGPILWALTGGTFGNLSELKFMRSLNKVAEKGDLLLLSVSTLREKKREERESVIVIEYEDLNEDNDPIDYKENEFTARMLRFPLIDLIESEEFQKQLHGENFKQRSAKMREKDLSVEELLANLQGTPKPGFSDIEGCKSIELRCNIGGDQESVDVTLHSHTVYHPDRLVEFLLDSSNSDPNRTIGGKWDIQTSVRSNDYPDFTQFLFKKI